MASMKLKSSVSIMNSIGIAFQARPMGIILPMGISFYTFQTMSYTIDIYKKQIKPANTFLDFALYVTFFPQLVAGPIVRAKDFIPQIRKPFTLKLSEQLFGKLALETVSKTVLPKQAVLKTVCKRFQKLICQNKLF